MTGKVQRRKNLDWRGEIKIRITIKITIEEGEGINHGWARMEGWRPPPTGATAG